MSIKGHHFWSQRGFGDGKFYFLVLLLVGTIVFLRTPQREQNLSSPNESSKSNTTSSLNWQGYMPINIQYDAWAEKFGFSSDQSNEQTDECNFLDYIFGQPVSQTDPCLIQAFKDKYLISPPPQIGKPSRTGMNFDHELPANQQKFYFIEKLLIENSTDGPGFFIECGANDGLYISSTIRLEKVHNWSGLLIEANSGPFANLLEVKRNAYAVNAALCATQNPQSLDFFEYPEHTGWSGLEKKTSGQKVIKTTVQCIPLYTILKALNVTTVDYLNLDVEGVELEILQTLPFGKDAENGEEIIFKVLTVEYKHIKGGLEALRNFLEPKGYKWIKNLLDSSTIDALFVHESLYEKAKTIKI